MPFRFLGEQEKLNWNFFALQKTSLFIMEEQRPTASNKTKYSTLVRSPKGNAECLKFPSSDCLVPCWLDAPEHTAKVFFRSWKAWIVHSEFNLTVPPPGPPPYFPPQRKSVKDNLTEKVKKRGRVGQCFQRLFFGKIQFHRLVPDGGQKVASLAVSSLTRK